MTASSLETAQTWRVWAAELAAADPRSRRFGARHHRYRVREPLGEARVRAIEAELDVELPPDYREFVVGIGDGGVGPYHGLWPLDHAAQRACAAGAFAFEAPALAGSVTATSARAEPADERERRDRDAWSEGSECGEEDPVYRGAIGLGHLGCGQVALLVVRGAAAGEVWLDAREADAGVGPIAPSFRAYVEEWIARTSRNQLPRAVVPAGRCPLPNALSEYLARCEEARGLARGTIGGEPLRAALSALGPGAIAVTATRGTPFFAQDEPLDRCPACEVMIENLRGHGLAADAVVEGVAAIPARGA